MGTLANITTITDTQSYKTLENQNTLKTRVKQNVFNQLIYNQDSGKDLHGIQVKKRLSKKLTENGTLNQNEQRNEKEVEIQNYNPLD